MLSPSFVQSFKNTTIAMKQIVSSLNLRRTSEVVDPTRPAIKYSFSVTSLTWSSQMLTQFRSFTFLVSHAVTVVLFSFVFVNGLPYSKGHD